MGQVSTFPPAKGNALKFSLTGQATTTLRIIRVGGVRKARWVELETEKGERIKVIPGDSVALNIDLKASNG